MLRFVFDKVDVRVNVLQDAVLMGMNVNFSGCKKFSQCVAAEQNQHTAHDRLEIDLKRF